MIGFFHVQTLNWSLSKETENLVGLNIFIQINSALIYTQYNS